MNCSHHDAVEALIVLEDLTRLATLGSNPLDLGIDPINNAGAICGGIVQLAAKLEEHIVAIEHRQRDSNKESIEETSK